MNRPMGSGIKRMIRVVAIIVCSISWMGFGAAQAAPVVGLSAEPIEGVTFDLLAAEEMQQFRFHVDGIELSRIEFTGGMVSERVVAAEQLFFVEWGRVEVRDWATDEVVTELNAGDSYGGSEQEVYLIATESREASILRFRVGGILGSSNPEATYKSPDALSTECAVGTSRAVPAREAVSTVLLRFPDANERTVPASDFTIFLGVLRVEPGAGIGHLDGNSGSYESNGPIVVMPSIGSFGDAVDQPQEEIASFRPSSAALVAQTDGAGVRLVNQGSFAVTALILGAVPTGETILHSLDA